MKIKFKILLFLTFSILSIFCRIHVDDFFMNTIYTVSGIMFSIGLGLIVTFNLQGVKNKVYIEKIRKNLKDVRNRYISYFSVSTVCFIVNKYLSEIDVPMMKHSIISIKLTESFQLNFNVAVFLVLIMFYSIVYFIINFLAIQKLNDDLFDKLNE